MQWTVIHYLLKDTGHSRFNKKDLFSKIDRDLLEVMAQAQHIRELLMQQVYSDCWCSAVAPDPLNLQGSLFPIWTRVCSRFQFSGRIFCRVIRHQWTRPQKGRWTLKCLSRKFPVLNSVLNSVLRHITVNRPTRRRWCSGLGQGRAPSASTEGQHTLGRWEADRTTTKCSDNRMSAQMFNFQKQEKRCICW